MLDDLIATYVKVCHCGEAFDVRVSVWQCGAHTRKYCNGVKPWIVVVDDFDGGFAPECYRFYFDRESAVLAAEALAMRLHQGGEYATAAEFNRAMELEG